MAGRRTLRHADAMARYAAPPAPTGPRARAALAPALTSIATPLALRALGYTGARGDKRELADWWPGVGSPDADTLRDLPTLRGRARDLDRNEALVAGALSTHVTKTIGVGLLPQPRLDRDLLQLDEATAAAWERRTKLLFWQFAGTADFARRLTLFDLMRVAFRSELASGDVFAVRRYKQRRGDLFGLKVQLIEADRVSNPDDAPDTDRVIAGVETDADGAPVRYHIRDVHPGDLRFGLPAGGRRWTAAPAFGAATGERLTLHCFDPLRPGQTRGVPLASPAILLFKQLTRYAEAEILAAVVSACFTIIEIPPAPVTFDDTGVPLPTGLTSAPSQPVADENGGVGFVPAPTPDGQVRMDSGAVVTTVPGGDVKFADPTRPNANYDPFVTALLRQIGPALDIPYEVLVQHFASSYSASRAALLELWEKITVRRARFIRQFAQPVYEWMLAEAIATGLLDAPGFDTDPLLRSAWCAAEWVGPAAGQLDELKAVQAAQARVDGGFSSIEREAQQLTGADWEETHAQQAKERAARVRDGLAQPAAPPAARPGAPDAADPTPADTPDGVPA